MADIEPQQTNHPLRDSFPRPIPPQRDNHALRSVGVSLCRRDAPSFAGVDYL